MDFHGNINATEGVHRCQCGSKYWENDACVDCGTLYEIAWLRQRAGSIKYGNEVRLNVMFATMTYYDLPWLVNPPITDLVDINAKYIAKGVIR